MQRYLRNNQLRVEKVPFPLFHETSLEDAQNIMINGIDIIRVIHRDCREYGVAFCTCPDLQNTYRKGNFQGAIVEFGAWQGESPRCLTALLPGLNLFFSGGNFQFKKPPFYTFRTLCAELSATSILAGGIVFLYDSFEQYTPIKVIA